MSTIDTQQQQQQPHNDNTLPPCPLTTFLGKHLVDAAKEIAKMPNGLDIIRDTASEIGRRIVNGEKCTTDAYVRYAFLKAVYAQGKSGKQKEIPVCYTKCVTVPGVAPHLRRLLGMYGCSNSSPFVLALPLSLSPSSV